MLRKRQGAGLGVVNPSFCQAPADHVLQVPDLHMPALDGTPAARLTAKVNVSNNLCDHIPRML